MSHEKCKAIMFFFLGWIFGAVIFGVLLCAGGVAGSEICTGKRTEIYADRSTDVESFGERTFAGIEELAGKIDSAGNKTAECITELTECLTEFGELKDDCDRIEEAGTGIEITVEGLEERILDCLQILGVSEEDEELLDGYGLELYDPGGR